MTRNVERTISEPLTAREAPPGVWRLSGGAAGGIEIILRGAEPDARAALSDIHATGAVVSWQAGGAVVTLNVAGGTRRIRARTVILHEPKAGLFDGLPLVRLDAAAKRFWRRVFWLVRIPGGRRLLGLVARRSAGPK
jgi:hypothetical protein